MIRAVFDTNVLVSSLIRHGKPRDLWNCVLDGRITLVTSKAILDEFDGVVARPKITRYLDDVMISKFRQILYQVAEIVEIDKKNVVALQSSILKDPDDNVIIETALVGKSDYIISGDKDLLDLMVFEKTEIVSVEQMLEILSE